MIAISRYAMADKRKLQLVEGDDNNAVKGGGNEKAGEDRLNIGRSDDDGIVLEFGNSK